MALRAKRWMFTRPLVQDAPEHAGVYALWSGERLVHLGCAQGSQTLRDKLLGHLRSGGPEARATHYSWEITREPLARLHELAGELEETHLEPRR